MVARTHLNVTTCAHGLSCYTIRFITRSPSHNFSTSSDSANVRILISTAVR